MNKFGGIKFTHHAIGNDHWVTSICLRLAEANLEVASSNPEQAQEATYCALTHLAAVKELNINIHKWDNLCVLDDNELLGDAYAYAKEKLEELRCLSQQSNKEGVTVNG